MATTITLQNFSAGDVDYIAKLNSNSASLIAAINQLYAAVGSGSISSVASPGMYLQAIFQNLTTLIGVSSYTFSTSGNNMTVTAGSAYRAISQSIVTSNVSTVIGFVSLAAATYYISLDSIGVPTRGTSPSTSDLYSVVWTGTAFGTITLLPKVAFDAPEESNARLSTTNSVPYATLDARMEAIETMVNSKLAASVLKTSPALVENSDSFVASQKATKSYVDGQISALLATSLSTFGDVKGPSSAVNLHLAIFDGTTGKLLKDGGPIPSIVSSGSYADLSNKPTRKVGVTVDGAGSAPTTGPKGAIQVDFAGTIVGWEVIADQVGSLTVEVDIARTSPPTAPPSAPLIPNTTTDKVSASAPITLSSAQSAATSTTGVSTWATAVNKWDVIQFNVTSAVGLTRASLYVTIQEP